MPFVKGKSGNPAGTSAPQSQARKRAARRIAELTGDGDEIIGRLLLLSRGVTSADDLERHGGAAAFADGRIAPGLTVERIRMAQAATLDLRDMLCGKPTQHVEVEDVTDPAATLAERLAELTPEQLALLANLDAPASAEGTSARVAGDPDAPALH